MALRKAKAKKKGGYPRAALKEAVIDFNDQSEMLVLFGESDRNLHFIEEALDLKIGRDGSSLIIRGQDAAVDLAVDVLSQLRGIVAGGAHVFSWRR